MFKTLKSKTVKAIFALTVIMAFSATAAFADPTPPPVDMGAALTTSVQTASTSTTGYYALLLPIALGVFAVGWGIRKALRFFKSASN